MPMVKGLPRNRRDLRRLCAYGRGNKVEKSYAMGEDPGSEIPKDVAVLQNGINFNFQIWPECLPRVYIVPKTLLQIDSHRQTKRQEQSSEIKNTRTKGVQQ